LYVDIIKIYPSLGTQGAIYRRIKCFNEEGLKAASIGSRERSKGHENSIAKLKAPWIVKKFEQNFTFIVRSEN
jgi:hypothetical protein